MSSEVKRAFNYVGELITKKKEGSESPLDIMVARSPSSIIIVHPAVHGFYVDEMAQGSHGLVDPFRYALPGVFFL